MRFATLLKSDIDELANRFARWWTGSLHRYPVAMAVTTLGVYGVLIVLAWAYIGPTYGVLVLSATLALYGLGVVTAWRRRLRREEASPPWRPLKAVLVSTSGLLMWATGLWILMQGELRPAVALCVLGGILALYPFGTRL